MCQLLSIDVAAGALASGSLAAWWLGLEMPWAWWVALPLSVWVIYTLDHLLDARRLKGQAHTPRHLFHHQHFTVIVIGWMLGFVSCFFLLPVFLPWQIWWFGLGMGGLVLLHLGLVKLIGDRVSWLFHKELGVALIYALGVWGGPLSLIEGDWMSWHWLPLLQFLALALINLLAFSAYEVEVDQLDGHTSFVRAIGRKNTRLLIGLLAFVHLGIGGYLGKEMALPDAWWLLQAIMAIMLFILLLISYWPRYFTQAERYRLWGDAVFILPLMIWLWKG
jgi:hypothetical protein